MRNGRKLERAVRALTTGARGRLIRFRISLPLVLVVATFDVVLDSIGLVVHIDDDFDPLEQRSWLGVHLQIVPKPEGLPSGHD